MADSTHIRLRTDTADALHALKQRGDSYDDVVRELIAESQRATIDVERERTEIDA